MKTKSNLYSEKNLDPRLKCKFTSGSRYFSDRLKTLATPRYRPNSDEMNKRKDAFTVSRAALRAKPTPRISELAEPRRIHYSSEEALMNHLTQLERIHEAKTQKEYLRKPQNSARLYQFKLS